MNNKGIESATKL